MSTLHPDPLAVTAELTVSIRTRREPTPTLEVTASGQVRSLGFTAPTLARVRHPAPPADGVQEYRLTATPPAGAAAPALATVTAQEAWPDYRREAPWLRGVRVVDGKGGGPVAWVRADVFVPADRATAEARAGQVVALAVGDDPSAVKVTVDGRPVPHSIHPGLDRAGDRPVAGPSPRCVLFPAPAAGRHTVRVSAATGDRPVRTVALQVGG